MSVNLSVGHKIGLLRCQAGFKGKCAIITSYQPQSGDISKEDSGEGATERLRQYQIYRQMLADHFNEPADQAVSKVELFEKQVKERFVNEPGQMRLLIVVDKLLTGFDAPSATYLYIDKKMQDHGLFQAICRVNRLDGEDKDYGYIVDYRDLFNSLESAITDYTGGALDGYDKKDIEGLLSDRIEKAHEDLDEALEQIRALCEPVAPPKGTLQYQKYFCAAEQGNAEQLKANEPKRVELYKAVAALVRTYGNLANEMEAAGYSAVQAEAIKKEVAHYANVRDEVKLGAGEDVDFKQYEAGMRHLLDTYIQAKPSEVLSDLDDATLIDLIVKLGAGAIDKLPEGIKKNPEAVAETIANNIRKVITDERPMNPKYYDRMSELLDALLEERRKGALEYKEYLKRLLEHATKLGKGESETAYPEWADNGARRALVDFFWPDLDVAVEVDRAVRHSKPDSWVGNGLKEKKVKRAIKAALPDGYDRLDELFELVKARHEEEYQHLHTEILKYLLYLRDKATTGLDPALVKNLYSFKEVKQNWLGFTVLGNGGSGLGRGFAQALYESLGTILASFGTETVTKASHLEKLCLIRGGVGRDNISDFTTNLIKHYLCEYTEAFAQQYMRADQCRELPVTRVCFNYESESWETRRYFLPVMDGDFVLLTPVDMLTRDDTWINHSDMIHQFEQVAEAVEDDQLRAQMNQYLRSRLTARRPTAAQRTQAVQATIAQFPQLIDYYIKKKEDEGDQAESESARRVEETDAVFVRQLQQLLSDLEERTDFYRRPVNSYEDALDRARFFKQYIENQDGYRLINKAGKPFSNEKDVQLYFGLVWYKTEFDVNREANNGRGPVDFAVSRGRLDKSLIEFKLASNPKLKQNLERQLPVYEAANQTRKSVTVIICYTAADQSKVARSLHELGLEDNESIVVIDARSDNKPSGSRA